MVYSIENAFQLIVLLVGSVTAIWYAVKKQKKVWLLLALFFGCWVFDDLYWLLIWIFYGSTPSIGVLSDLCWYASYIFLYLLLIEAAPPEKSVKKSLWPWFGPLFTIAMAFFYMQWGDELNNLLYGIFIGLVMFAAIRRLTDGEYRKVRSLALVTLIFCLLEYCMWTASCFFKEDTLVNPYYWFDFLLTVSFLLFLPAVRKAVAE